MSLVGYFHEGGKPDSGPDTLNSILGGVQNMFSSYMDDRKAKRELSFTQSLIESGLTPQYAGGATQYTTAGAAAPVSIWVKMGVIVAALGVVIGLVRMMRG